MIVITRDDIALNVERIPMFRDAAVSADEKTFMF